MEQTNQIAVPTKSSVHKAGKILRHLTDSESEINNAIDILSTWRSLHTYPIRTFRAYIDKHLKRNHFDDTIVAQRLKRLPSIINKLDRFPAMGLETMQDIGGIRIILKDNVELERLYNAMQKSRFEHRPILPPNDYIASPKLDGYRSLHQVYRYTSKNHPELNVLHIELQLRTKLQHAWATAVETLGIIEKSSFKTGEGDDSFKQFFKLSSALFSLEEKKPVLKEFDSYRRNDLVEKLVEIQKTLQIFDKLQGLAISAKHIELSSKETNSYHLMTLDLEKKKISLIPFQNTQLSDAEALYREKEKEARGNNNLSIVLISAGNVKEIKKAYPNYFLDTDSFIRNLRRLCDK